MIRLRKEKKEETRSKGIDFALLFSVLILLFVGIIVLSSASSYYSLINYDNSTTLLNKQIIFATIGVVVMLIVSRIDYNIYMKWGYLGFVIGIVLMVAVFIPGLGRTINGANRWLNLGLLTFQPSEMMKILLIIAVSTYMIKNEKRMEGIKKYFLPLVILGLVFLLMYFQSHMSGAVVMIVIVSTLIFADGIKLRLKYIIPIALLIITAIVILIFAEPYRLERIKAFFNQEEDITGSNWQPTQSLYAIGSGGVLGKGLGQSLQKYSWLPEAQNDFVFAILGEEFGFVGTVTVIFLYAFFIKKGMQVSRECRNKFGMLISAGIIVMFAFQAIVNIAVVTSIIPTTGMPLPFFSAGGTSLLINLAAVGVILNVSRDRKTIKED